MSSQATHYFNGKWVSEGDLQIPLFDISILRGFGVFDFLRTYNRKPFKMTEHVDRLLRSAKTVALTVPLTRPEIEALILEGISKNPFHNELYIKLILTGGTASDAISPNVSPSFAITFQKAGQYPPEDYSHGINIKSFVHERFLPEIKSLNYSAAVYSLQLAKKENASEVVYLNKEGNILEGTTWNFFAVRDGKIYTSKDEILYGITRGYLLQLVRSETNIEVVEGPLRSDQISTFQEVFLTSTTKEVMPIVKIDNQKIGDGSVGPVTKLLMELFARKAREL